MVNLDSSLLFQGFHSVRRSAVLISVQMSNNIGYLFVSAIFLSLHRSNIML